MQKFTYDWNKRMAYYVEEFMERSGMDTKYNRLRAFNTFHNYDYMTLYLYRTPPLFY